MGLLSGGLGNVLGAAASAAAPFSVLGQVGGSLWQQNVNQASANKQMDYQSKMSNTAYQRAMADMKKAGLNPILVAKLGGASTPTGAMAKVDNPNLSGALHSGYQNKLLREQTTVAKKEAEKATTVNEVYRRWPAIAVAQELGMTDTQSIIKLMLLMESGKTQRGTAQGVKTFGAELAADWKAPKGDPLVRPPGKKWNKQKQYWQDGSKKN